MSDLIRDFRGIWIVGVRSLPWPGLVRRTVVSWGLHVFKFRWLLAVSMALIFIGAPPASAYEPPGGATFNVPRPWGTQAEKWRIDQTITQAIEHTPGYSDGDPGTRPEIHISTYLLDYAPGVTAMIDACKRG